MSVNSMYAPRAARVLSLLLVFLTTACSTLNFDLPAVTPAPTGASLPGKIIWHDLLTEDIDASRRFYGELFGWEFDPMPLTLGVGKSSQYLLIRHKGKLIGGMVDVSNVGTDLNSSQWVVVMAVTDLDAAVAGISGAGGKVLTPPTDLNERGRIAVVTDQAGALFAVLQTRDGDPLDVSADFGEFMWDEVWTPDIERSAAFYQALAPFEQVSANLGAESIEYKGLKAGGRPRVGLLRNPLEDKGLAPTWVSYLRVADMSALDRVAALGGQVLVPAQDRAIGGQVAIIAGPSGAAVALQTWDEN